MGFSITTYEALQNFLIGLTAKNITGADNMNEYFSNKSPLGERLVGQNKLPVHYETFAPDLTGGNKVAYTTYSTTSEDDTYINNPIGVYVGAPLTGVIKSVANAYGISLTTERILDVARDFLGMPTITLPEAEGKLIEGFINESASHAQGHIKTYINSKDIEAIAGAISNLGLFEYDIETETEDEPETGQFLPTSYATALTPTDIANVVRLAGYEGQIQPSSYATLVNLMKTTYPTLQDGNNYLQLGIYSNARGIQLVVYYMAVSSVAYMVTSEKGTNYSLALAYGSNGVRTQFGGGSFTYLGGDNWRYNTYIDAFTPVVFGFHKVGSINILSLIDTTITDIAPEGVERERGADIPTTADTKAPARYSGWAQDKIGDLGLWDGSTVDEDEEYYPIDLNDIDDLVRVGTQEGAQAGTIPLISDLSDAIVRIVEQIRAIVDDLTQPIPEGGDTPVVPTPTSGSVGLFKVFNPSQSQLNSLSAELWTDSVVESVKRIFSNNPIDGIINLHLMYATPTVGSAQTIKLGYYECNTSAPVVTNQYAETNCGTIDLAEFYGDSMDYEPFTKVTLYLPFIGFVPISANDVIGKKVTLRYKFDVITGACLASVIVKSNGTLQTLYEFEGNCAVQLPLSSANAHTLQTIAGGVGLGVGLLTGNAGLATMGAQGALQNVGKDVSRSGSFSANAGVMGTKTPYFVITRMIEKPAEGYKQYFGEPNNKTVLLGNQSGFVRVLDIVSNNIGCTSEERNEIETLLKSGVFL